VIFRVLVKNGLVVRPDPCPYHPTGFWYCDGSYLAPRHAEFAVCNYGQCQEKRDIPAGFSPVYVNNRYGSKEVAVDPSQQKYLSITPISMKTKKRLKLKFGKTLLDKINKFQEDIDKVDPHILRPGAWIKFEFTGMTEEGFYLGKESGRHVIGLMDRSGWAVGALYSHEQQALAKSLGVQSCNRHYDMPEVIGNRP